MEKIFDQNNQETRLETVFKEAKSKMRKAILVGLGLLSTSTSSAYEQSGNEGSLFYKGPAAIEKYVRETATEVNYEPVFENADVVTVGEYHLSPEQYEEIISVLNRHEELGIETVCFERRKEYQPILNRYMADLITFEECMREIQIYDLEHGDREIFPEEMRLSAIKETNERPSSSFSDPFVKVFKVMKVAKELGLRVVAMDKETKDAFETISERNETMSQIIKNELGAVGDNKKVLAIVGSIHTGYPANQKIKSINQYLLEDGISNAAVDYVSPEPGHQLFSQTPGFSGYIKHNIVKDENNKDKSIDTFVTIAPEGYIYSDLNPVMEKLGKKDPVMIPVPLNDEVRGSDVIVWLPHRNND